MREEHRADDLRSVQKQVRRAQEQDIHPKRQRVAAKPQLVVNRTNGPRRYHRVGEQPRAEHGINPPIDAGSEEVRRAEEHHGNTQRGGMPTTRPVNPAPDRGRVMRIAGRCRRRHSGHRGMVVSVTSPMYATMGPLVQEAAKQDSPVAFRGRPAPPPARAYRLWVYIMSTSSSYIASASP